MDTTTLAIGALVVVLLVLVWLFVSSYNRLFRFRNAAEAELGQIRVAMKKRFDMIEQLLGAVKGYTKFEREVFEKVAALRAQVLNAGPANLADIQRESANLFGSIRAVAEAYPDLKASETVKKLMEAIIGLEDEIGRQRYTYNNVVQEFNTMVDTIPTNIVAGVLGLTKLEYLKFGDEIETPPKASGIGPDE
ncbi:MAG: LemA family protein [Candidatus Bathyarchaeota archaeon]|nr:LemA family protein [Candidatus Bathyarchaeota archaeon]